MSFFCSRRSKVRVSSNRELSITEQRKMELQRRRAMSSQNSRGGSKGCHVPPRSKSLDAFRPPPILVPA
ncbi:hypothetical protein DQ04_02991100 [Trypanosoma grayi]|uniref:hypothetical protein n=1 Tax=Trypanosoma grayi TaxID=71804 RepID=UPI0004F42994|nr:hypothetical protein DQ04_02991100 [Trypanosoma grayi]KEG11094.1 hypothetical protein DQ04_02991100 [Trypanosoma grayi]